MIGIEADHQISVFEVPIAISGSINSPHRFIFVADQLIGPLAKHTTPLAA
jgi:hypothetical protein